VQLAIARFDPRFLQPRIQAREIAAPKNRLDRAGFRAGSDERFVGPFA